MIHSFTCGIVFRNQEDGVPNNYLRSELEVNLACSTYIHLVVTMGFS